MAVMTTGMTNYIAALVDELYQLGVREVVISPGSRSTPLAMLFCEHRFRVFLNIDERCAAFFALGIAKEQGRPAVLVCTSGSAVAHYLPALIEARYSRVPLIVLTADRPHELRQVGAPQTIDQNKIYGEYTHYYEELALPEDEKSMHRYVRVVMQKAYAAAMSDPCGVAHINVPLREPLIPDFVQLDFTTGRLKAPFIFDKTEGQYTIDDTIFLDKNGIIICGPDAYTDYHQDVLELGGRLKAAVLADPLSNFRNYNNELLIDSYDAFLKDDDIKHELKPDFILHFGQAPVSKRLMQFLSLHQDALYIQVDRVFQYRNPSLSTDQFVVSSPKMFARAIAVQNASSYYLSKWQSWQRQMREHLNNALQDDRLFEGQIMQKLQENLPDQTRVVAANSMAIRDLDTFFAARSQRIKILGNRGANGIDGIVSTALGVSVSGKPTVLITGDLALFHDLNGLLIGKTHKLNVVIVLFNNNGGGIFKYLPQSQERHFEYLFLTPHGIDFTGLTALYGVTYYQPKNLLEFEQDFRRAQSHPGIKLIEVKIDLEQSKDLHDLYTRMPAIRV